MVGTLAAVPASAMHVFNFIATMWNGRIKFATPMMWAVGGIALFFSAGAGGVVNAAMPLDFTTHDTYWVVGHFHLSHEENPTIAKRTNAKTPEL